jgi:tRNA-splicing ligase RtcB
MIISGKSLKQRGWPEGRLIRMAKEAAQALWQEDGDTDVILGKLDAVREHPGEFLKDPVLGALAQAVQSEAGQRAREQATRLRANPLEYRVWGERYIDPGALAQMDNAMRLPVSVAGALMPDAHVGYGLPIGGVLATEGTIIPYAVGVDIACRMRLSVFRESPEVLDSRPEPFKQALLKKTRFGTGGRWERSEQPEHAVLDDADWQATTLLRGLQAKARDQIGTSGTGNHFVEWGALDLRQPLGDLAPGRYLALLSHSGSRGVGYAIADAYSKLAMRLHPKLDDAVRHLAWLGIDSEPGQEYWRAMNLAGRFASANHHVIHARVAAAAGLEEAAAVENHHNFAWAETLPDGRTAYVHRKGATPAGPGVLGIIPGSMGDPGYLVSGRGVAASLNSAAHGAGRALSRKKAFDTISKKERDRYLAERGVTLLGGGLDESPQAYKRIDEVIAAQADLVDILGAFTPRIVRMAEEKGGDW